MNTHIYVTYILQLTFCFTGCFIAYCSLWAECLCPSKNSYTEALISNVMVFGNEEIRLGHQDEIFMVGLVALKE